MSSLAARRVIGRIAPKQCVLLVCDIQERFRPVIHGFPELVGISTTMLRASNALNIPVVVSEQYPKAFGRTVDEILKHLPATAKVFEKRRFSMITEETSSHLRALEVTSAVLVGLETHVCVLQTTLDLLEMGIDVHVIADGVSSQRLNERNFALERLRQSGAFITSAESALFQILGTSEHEHFKTISSIVKDQGVKSREKTLLGCL